MHIHDRSDETDGVDGSDGRKEGVERPATRICGCWLRWQRASYLCLDCFGCSPLSTRPL